MLIRCKDGIRRLRAAAALQGVTKRGDGHLPCAPIDAAARPALGVEAQVHPHHRQQTCAGDLAPCVDVSKRQLNPAQPNQAWVAEITRLKTRQVV